MAGCCLIFTFTHCDIARRINGESIRSLQPADDETALRNDIVGYAREYVGARYKYAGKDPKTGFDCSGFTHFVMKKFDIKLSSSSRDQERQGEKIKVEVVKPGDLIFFRRSKSGPVFHVAMVVSKDARSLKVIHSTSRGVVIDNIYDSKYWKPKISSARDVIPAP